MQSNFLAWIRVELELECECALGPFARLSIRLLVRPIADPLVP